jgi:hypothetical protein
MRVPKQLLEEVKARAKARGIPIRASFGKPSNKQWRHPNSETVASAKGPAADLKNCCAFRLVTAILHRITIHIEPEIHIDLSDHLSRFAIH